MLVLYFVNQRTRVKLSVGPELSVVSGVRDLNRDR